MALDNIDREETRDAHPIVVDIDGQLLRGRALDEIAFQILQSAPSRVMRMLSAGAVAAAQGREELPLDASQWPANEEFVAYLQAQADRGREVVIATSADAAIGAALQTRFAFVRRVVQLDANLGGREKAEVLQRLFPAGFVFTGRSDADHEVWQQASSGIAVNAPAAVVRRLEADGTPAETFSEGRFNATSLRRTLRLHQWAKNLLIFIPLVLGGKFLDLTVWTQALIGFLALGLVASGTYIINDLMDLNSDRGHWHKRYRPLASGELSIRSGLLLAAVCLVGGFALAAWAGRPALLMVGLYFFVTLAYSLFWKRIPILDVTVLASLYTLRLGLGTAITGVTVSSWLLVFSMFVFLSLSLAKRHTEVLRMRSKGPIAGRGYNSDDAPITLGLGLSAAMAAVVIMTVFLSEDVFNRPQYVEPHLLWAFPPILFLFLGRVWLLTQRGEMHDDPVAFALKDRMSVVLGGLMSILLVFALTGPKIW